MKPDGIKKLRKIFLSVFPHLNDKKLNFDMDRSEFENWDSLTHMQLISEIESAFNINFDMDEIVDINKPSELVTLIERKFNG